MVTKLNWYNVVNEINGKVDEAKTAANEAVEAVGGLSETVGGLSETVGGLSESVDELSGLTVHNVKISKANDFEVHLQVVNKKSTAYASLAEFITANGATLNSPVTGFYYTDSVYITVMTVAFNNDAMILYGFKSSSANYDIKNKTWANIAADGDVTFVDYVKGI